MITAGIFLLVLLLAMYSCIVWHIIRHTIRLRRVKAVEAVPDRVDRIEQLDHIRRMEAELLPEAPPVLTDAIMQLRAVCGDTDVMAERIKQAALLEAAGVDPGAVTALAKAAAQGVMTPDDLIRINSAGISVRPVVDWARTQGKEKP